MIGTRARGDLLHDPAVPGKGWEGCHDLTGPRSLVCIAPELREREAARAARAARRRRSWLFRLVRRIRDWRARWDRGAERRPEAKPCAACGVEPTADPRGVCYACRQDREEELEAIRDLAADRMIATLGADEHLALARAAALRDGRQDLAAAVHTVRLLDLTGNLDDMGELVARVRASFAEGLGDLPRADVN